MNNKTIQKVLIFKVIHFSLFNSVLLLVLRIYSFIIKITSFSFIFDKQMLNKL